MTAIPFVDLQWQHERISGDVEKGWKEIVDSSSFILGDVVRQFEEDFADYSGAARCVGVGNGTDALELLLRAVDIGPGDEVIVPTNSFIASATAVVRAGAKPILVDVDATYHLIDPDRAAAAITPSTKAIMPVHLYGQMAPVEELIDLVDGSEIAIIEDGAQAHGARRHNLHMGSRALGAATSFYPGKNLGAYGDGGAVLTNSPHVADRLLALRNLGSTRKYHHPEVGFNSRLDPLQAVVVSAKLRHLDDWNRLRREIADRYRRLLSEVPGVSVPEEAPGNDHVWHLFVVKVPSRDAVAEALRRRGIETGIHYPVPIHLHGAMDFLGHEYGDFPVAEQLAEQILSLPMFPGLTEDAQERVVASLAEALSQ